MDRPVLGCAAEHEGVQTAMAWWLWFLAGIGLLVVEMVTPGALFALFFGISALILSGLVGLGLAGPDWVQWIIFSALSVAALALLRRRLQDRTSRASVPVVDSLVGATALLLEDLAAGGTGKAELQGSTWNARSAAHVSLRGGQRYRVERVDGLTLLLRDDFPSA
ncbi:MAG TPA: NfeD family protein [Myxococcaceae bacterium]|nr:NfeD family protein [Myxococcaceae bacterium]